MVSEWCLMRISMPTWHDDPQVAQTKLSFVKASSSESHASHPPQVQFLWLRCSPGDLAISDGWHPSRLTCTDVPHPTQRCFLLVNRDQYGNGFFPGYNLIWWINIGCPKIAKSMIPILIIPGPSVLLFDPHSKTSMRSRWLNIIQYLKCSRDQM